MRSEQSGPKNIQRKLSILIILESQYSCAQCLTYLSKQHIVQILEKGQVATQSGQQQPTFFQTYQWITQATASQLDGQVGSRAWPSQLLWSARPRPHTKLNILLKSIAALTFQVSVCEIGFEIDDSPIAFIIHLYKKSIFDSSF